MDKHFHAKPNGHMRGITHHVPHRTRYRLASHHRNDEMIDRVKNSLAKVPGINKIEYNQRTGSLLVHHDEIPGVLGRLGTLFGEIATDLFEELAEEEIAVVPGISLFADMIGRRFALIDQYVARRTNNYVDLKMVLPLVFATAGLLKFSREEKLFSQVPAYVFFYYAYDSFLKLNVSRNHSPAHAHGNGHKGIK